MYSELRNFDVRSRHEDDAAARGALHAWTGVAAVIGALLVLAML